MQFSIVRFSDIKEQKNFRFDAEYWHPELIKLSLKIGKNLLLGDVIDNGYRVVYENTKIFGKNEIKNEKNPPKFLQATNINTPVINIEQSGYVSNTDWLRYPMGHVKEGEILLEVKGDVRRVVIVPDNFPKKVLISGTLYKLTVNNLINKYFLVTYLSCSYGQKLKNRLVSNIATPFISKSELYNIPLPDFSVLFQEKIEGVYKHSIRLIDKSSSIYRESKNLLLTELRLNDWQPQRRLTFIKDYADVKEAERFDAESFQPKYDNIINAIKTYKGGWDALGNLCALVGHPSNPPYAENSEPNKTFVVAQKHLGDYSLSDDFWQHEDAKYTTKEFVQKNEQYILKKEDLVLYTVGAPPHIGKANMIFETEVSSTIGSFVTLVRADQAKINPFYLLVLFNSPIGYQLTNRFQRGMVQQYIYPKDLVKTIIPILPTAKQQQIQEKVIESFNLRKQSKQLLENAKRAVEMAIEQDEKTALQWLEESNKDL